MNLFLPKRTLLAWAVALLALHLPPVPAAVEAPPAAQPARLLVAQNRITLEQAVERVQRATGGRVLDARASGNKYRIKVLTRDGEVRIVTVDARTGELR